MRGPGHPSPEVRHNVRRSRGSSSVPRSYTLTRSPPQKRAPEGAQADRGHARSTRGTTPPTADQFSLCLAASRMKGFPLRAPPVPVRSSSGVISNHLRREEPSLIFALTDPGDKRRCRLHDFRRLALTGHSLSNHCGNLRNRGLTCSCGFSAAGVVVSCLCVTIR